MANIPQSGDRQTQSQQQRTRPVPPDQSLEDDDRGTQPYQSQRQDETPEQPGDDPQQDDNYIGDPQPAEKETIRASTETGEDEDLPSDDEDDGDRGIESAPASTGSDSERH
jgi:hypothetical protein